MNNGQGLSYTLNEQINAIRYEMEEQKIVILVEGEDDKLFYSYYFEFDDNLVLFYHPISDYNKGTVIDITLNQPDFCEVIGIVDKDYDTIENTTIDNSNLFYTDFHDLETFIIMSDALEKLLINRNIGLSDIKGIKNFPSEINRRSKLDTFRDLIFKKSELLGKLRLLNRRKNWMIPFKKIIKDDWQSSFFQQLAFEKVDLCIHFLISSRNSKKSFDPISATEVKDALDRLEIEVNHPILCHGKDMIKIVIFYFNTYLRKKRKESFDKGNIFDSYEKGFFSQTTLFKELTEKIDTLID